jgi:hypothetical protein
MNECLRSPMLIGAVLGICGCGKVDAPVLPADATRDAATDAAPAPDTRPAADAGATPDAAPRITSALDDFSVTQDQGGWRYLYQEPGQPLKELPAAFGEIWWMNFDQRWTQIGADYAHPNFGGKADMTGGFPGMGIQHAVRRWTSDAAGAADIDYTVSKRDDAVCGDGVLTRILADGVQLVEHAIAGDDEIGVTGTLHAQLRAGSTVDLVVEPNADDACDSTRTLMTITVR